jgi:hypothetical protein
MEYFAVEMALNDKLQKIKDIEPSIQTSMAEMVK